MNKKAMRDPDFLNAIIENVGALVIVLDQDGRIYRFNAACEKLSGFTFAEVEGKFPWDIFLPAEDADTVHAAAFVAHVNNPQPANRKPQTANRTQPIHQPLAHKVWRLSISRMVQYGVT